MPQRIRTTEVAHVLADADQPQAEHDPDTDSWDPGYRCVQVGPRSVHLFHEGPADVAARDRYTALLRDRGYHVQADRPLGTRHRLIVTRP